MMVTCIRIGRIKGAKEEPNYEYILKVAMTKFVKSWGVRKEDSLG